MKIILNPKYKDLLPFLETLNESFDAQGELIYDGRNQLKRYQVEGVDFVVKRFKVPHFLNRIVYSFFRASKAKRSYEYALKYLERGISTPEPIAYLEMKSFGLLKSSFSISVYAENFFEIRKQMLNIDCDEEFIKNLALFIATVQNSGIFQCDLSPGNVLFKKEEGKYFFTLVDINRTKFVDQMSAQLRYSNFSRISEDPQVLEPLAKEFAKIISFDQKETIQGINNAVAKYSKKYKEILENKH